MQVRRLGLLVLGGLAISAGGAFTASNTFSNSGDVAGYGENTVTGATVTAITYTTLATDASKLASVVFTSSTNVTGDTAIMQLKNGAAVMGTPYSCALGTFVTSMTITCATADNPLIANFSAVGLDVHQ